jgi:hypothetical protein
MEETSMCANLRERTGANGFPPAMHAEFNCLFGISDRVDGLIEGTVDTLFDKGKSMLVATDNMDGDFSSTTRS